MTDHRLLPLGQNLATCAFCSQPITTDQLLDAAFIGGHRFVHEGCYESILFNYHLNHTWLDEALARHDLAPDEYERPTFVRAFNLYRELSVEQAMKAGYLILNRDCVEFQPLAMVGYIVTGEIASARSYVKDFPVPSKEAELPYLHPGEHWHIISHRPLNETAVIAALGIVNPLGQIIIKIVVAWSPKWLRDRHGGDTPALY